MIHESDIVRDKHSLNYILRDMHAHGSRKMVSGKHPSSRLKRGKSQVDDVGKKQRGAKLSHLHCLLHRWLSVGVLRHLVSVLVHKWQMRIWLIETGGPAASLSLRSYICSDADSQTVSIVWSSPTGCSPSTSPPPDTLARHAQTSMHRWSGARLGSVALWRTHVRRGCARRGWCRAASLGESANINRIVFAVIPLRWLRDT